MRILSKILISIWILALVTACYNVEKEYYESGNLKSKTKIKKGLKDGKSKYFYEDGSLSAIYNYENDKKNGLYKAYHKNGELSKVGFFKNDRLEGKVLQFADNGDTLLKHFYKDGIMELDIFYNKGRPRRIMDFNKGFMIVFDENGEIEKKVKIKER